MFLCSCVKACLCLENRRGGSNVRQHRQWVLFFEQQKGDYNCFGPTGRFTHFVVFRLNRYAYAYIKSILFIRVGVVNVYKDHLCILQRYNVYVHFPNDQTHIHYLFLCVSYRYFPIHMNQYSECCVSQWGTYHSSSHTQTVHKVRK